jgi:NADPH2:quinone reductase
MIMKTIRVHEFGGPEAMRLEEIEPPKPGPGQVVLRVRAAGVNPVDTYIRSGAYVFHPPLPYTPGIEGAGDVAAVGEGVKRFRPGDRVYCAGTVSGTYAEQALCVEGQVYPLPANISFAQGAGIPIPYGTAYWALFRRANARSGETVLVHGASGGVGLAAVQLARAAGLVVVGTAGSDEGLALASREGAHHVLNHHDPDHLKRILDLTGGVNVILEMLANVNLGADLTVLAKRGRVVVIGSRGNVEINPRDLMTREADIMGMSLMNVSNEERDSIHASLRAGLENGTLRPVVSKELPLANAAQAHRDVIESSTFGKIVLIP